MLDNLRQAKRLVTSPGFPQRNAGKSLTTISEALTTIFVCSFTADTASDERRSVELEAADAQIEAFIERRSRQREDDNRTEEAWKEMTRRYNARQREGWRWSWIRHHDRMCELHARLSAEHERKAEKLIEGSST